MIGSVGSLAILILPRERSRPASLTHQDKHWQLAPLIGLSVSVLSGSNRLLTAPALWKTYPPHENYGILPNVHKMAILDIAYSLDSEVLYSVCLDSAMWAL
jgi:hypothetical protein